MKLHSFLNSKCGLLLAASIVSFQAQAVAVLVSDARYVDGDVDFADQLTGGYDTPPYAFLDNWYSTEGTFREACTYSWCDPVITASGGASGEQVSGVTGYDDYNSPATATGLFGRGYGTVYIDDPNDSLGGVGTGDAESIYDISFKLLTAHTYNLTGTLSATATGTGAANATLKLGDINLVAADSPFALSGTLNPGDYRLLVTAGAYVYPNGSARATFDFQLALTEVPVPAAAWLFASGLAGLVGFGRKAAGYQVRGGAPA